MINCSQKKAHEKYEPPIAKKIPEKITTHGHTRIDNYYWLGERDNSEVIEYLKAENKYTEKVMVHTETLQEALFKEISGRINESSLSLPRREGDYWYYSRWEEGKEYPIYARKHASLEADEEILIDVNEIAEGHSYTRVSYPAISHDQNLMAFGTYTDDLPAIIRFKDLDADEFLDDVIEPATLNMTWANDNRTLFYAKVRSVGKGPKQIFRHVLGTDPDQDELVHEETEFRCLVWKIGGYIAIESFGPSRDEWLYLDADRPDGKFELFTPREPKHEYIFRSVGDYFYILTNHGGAQNSKLMRTHVSETGIAHWEEVIPHRDDVLLKHFRVFRNHLAVAERKDGLIQVRILPMTGESEHYLDFGEPVYGAYIIEGEPDSNILRYHYTSFTTPSSVYDYNMDTREKELVWREEVLGNFDPADYVSERLYAPARDGIRVPVSLVYRKEIEQDGMNPLLMYAYASSGSVDAEFDSSLLSLIDRGFVYAIAHVRGGDEMGHQWFVDGSLLNKMNTFTDFIDVATFLIDRDYTNRDKFFAHGLSSGGLLMGGIANMQPDLFKGIIAQVPWVDVLAGRHGSLGDPKEEKYYWYMLSYSPYDNVEAQGYPNMLVTAGFYDKMVPYSQPAKWVAKLRALKTDDNVLILKTNMEAGHVGPTGRQESWKEIAFMYAFLLDLVGINE
jgi:oligopeptidase B